MDPQGLTPVIIALLVILGIAAIIAAAVYVVLRMRAEGGLSFPLRFLFQIYLYMALLASLMVAVSGLAYLGQAAMSIPFGREFSYYPTYVPDPVRLAPDQEPREPAQTPEEQEQQRQEGLERAYKEGLLQGISLTLVGGIIWATHFVGRRRLERDEEANSETLLVRRIYLLVLLLVFSIITITSLPGAVFETLRHYLLDTDTTYGSPPGGRLATAIVALPLWLFYLRSALSALRNPTA